MSIPPINKEHMARSFSAAAETYETWATAQARIARALLERLPAGFSPSNGVELGCGTGIALRLLLKRFSGLRMIGVDIAEAMIRQCGRQISSIENCKLVQGDVEEESSKSRVIEMLGNTPLDLLVCASSSHWFSDTHATLRRWGAHLGLGGVLAVAAMLEGSCPELLEAYNAAVGRELALFRFNAHGAIENAARDAGLRVTRCDVEQVVSWYADPQSAMRSFHGIGATLTGQPWHVPLAAGRMRRLLDAYRRHARADGCVPVTFRVQYVIAEVA